MVILDSQYTDAGRSAAERFVAEEYFLDLLDSWEAHRYSWPQGLAVTSRHMYTRTHANKHARPVTQSWLQGLFCIHLRSL